MPVAIKAQSDAVFAYSPQQLAKAGRELETMKKEEAGGRRINKQAGDLRVRRVMHKTHFYNAIAAGEDPRHDEGYIKDHVKKGVVFEVPVAGGPIVGRPLSERGRQNFEAIFGRH